MITLHCEDNLSVLRRMPTASVDLVYLDPPFATQRVHRVTRGEAVGSVGFDDRFVWDEAAAAALDRCAGLDGPLGRVVAGLRTVHLALGDDGVKVLGWLGMMVPRLVELHRVLRPSGSLYLHCDQCVVYSAKLVLDAIFGPRTFLNHVIWSYGLGGSSPRYWPRKHDDLLWFARTENGQTFVADRVPATSNRMAGQDKKAPDVWDIPSINNRAAERLGWPTQKPLELLRRIVRSSSRPGDVVLDPFCGSGTTLDAAAELGRDAIGIDRSPEAVRLAHERLRARHGASSGVRVQPPPTDAVHPEPG